MYFSNSVPHLGTFMGKEVMTLRRRDLANAPYFPFRLPLAHTSVMAIFFLSKDIRICASSFCGTAWCGQGPVWLSTASLQAPTRCEPTCDWCKKASSPGYSSRRSSRGALWSSSGRRLICSGDCGKAGRWLAVGSSVGEQEVEVGI